MGGLLWASQLNMVFRHFKDDHPDREHLQEVVAFCTTCDKPDAWPTFVMLGQDFPDVWFSFIDIDGDFFIATDATGGNLEEIRRRMRIPGIKRYHEVVKLLDSIAHDPRLAYTKPAEIHINAPLALIQQGLENQMMILRWFLDDGGADFNYPRLKMEGPIQVGDVLIKNPGDPVNRHWWLVSSIEGELISIMDKGGPM